MELRLPESLAAMDSLESVEMASPAQRPVLITSRKELEALSGKLRTGPFSRIWDALLRSHADLTELQPPEANPPIADDHLVHGLGCKLLAMETILPTAALIWCLTRHSSQRELAFEWIRCALGWPHWSDGPHRTVDGYYDAAPETAAGMRALAWCLDLLDADLPDELKRRCQKKLALLAEQNTAISRSDAVQWARNVSTNWCAAMHSGIGVAALALAGADDRAKSWLRQALFKTLQFLEALPDDGSYPEGVAYWEYGLSNCCIFLEALYRQTGIDLRRHPSIERTRRFALNCLAPGANDLVQFNDSVPLRMTTAANGPLASLLVRWFKDPELRWAMDAAEGSDVVQPMNLLWYPASPRAKKPVREKGGSVYYPDTGWVVMRSGWNRDDCLVAFKSSPYWIGHAQLDQNAFEIFALGEELALDSGRGWYAHPNHFERYTSSKAHNTILVGGKGQAAYSAERFGRILECSLSDDVDYTVGECASTYDDVKSFRRHVLFLKPHLIVIYDSISLARGAPVQWLLHANKGFELHIHPKESGFTAYGESAALEAFVLSPEKWSYAQGKGYKLSDWQDRRDLTHPYISIESKPATEHEFLVVLKPEKHAGKRKFPGKILSSGEVRLDSARGHWVVRVGSEGLSFERL